jgi:tRNA-dihydrouridine synthase
MLEQTGCDAVMLGRAAFGDPWVFRRVRQFHAHGETLPPPGARDRLETGLTHLRMVSADFGEDVAAREMRKHVAWYIKGLPHSAKVREQVNRTRGVEEMAELLSGYLEQLAREGLDSFRDPEGAGAMPRGPAVSAAVEDAVAAG